MLHALYSFVFYNLATAYSVIINIKLDMIIALIKYYLYSFCPAMCDSIINGFLANKIYVFSIGIRVNEGVIIHTVFKFYVDSFIMQFAEHCIERPDEAVFFNINRAQLFYYPAQVEKQTDCPVI